MNFLPKKWDAKLITYLVLAYIGIGFVTAMIACKWLKC